MQPFVVHLIETWLQPLPFPTLFKLIYSVVLIILILLPIIYPLAVIICYYAIIQYLIESDLSVRYPKPLDLVHYVVALFSYQIENDKYVAFVNLYLERWRCITTALASCIDYMRLALSLLLG
ncbi:hypothetical protein DOY81_012165 [Sarcophaga bullata]|nr:hypothetical protein DOY81_012165 [Sarcophaga bullata]